MKMMQSLTAGLFLLCLASCGPQLAEPDLAHFPPSKGVYRGSLLWDRWVYRGTDQLGHHFTFSRSRDNILWRKDLIFATDSVKIDKPFPLSKDHSDWKSARDDTDGEKRIKGFTTHPTIMQRIDEARRTGNIVS